MRHRLTALALCLSSAAALGALGWLWLSRPGDEAVETALRPVAAGAPAPAVTPVQRPPPDHSPGREAWAVGAPEPPLGDDDYEDARRVCPWPPSVGTWRDLGGDCLRVMNNIKRRHEYYRRVFFLDDDPVATRRAVVAALDRPECHVPEGEARPDLLDACAAEAMVRLGDLQDECVGVLRADWDGYLDRWTALISKTASEEGRGQDYYHGKVGERQEALAGGLWSLFRCRSVQEVLEWIDTLPIPPPPRNPQVHIRRLDPPDSQAPYLIELAGRLGYRRPPD